MDNWLCNSSFLDEPTRWPIKTKHKSNRTKQNKTDRKKRKKKLRSWLEESQKNVLVDNWLCNSLFLDESHYPM